MAGEKGELWDASQDEPLPTPGWMQRAIGVGAERRRGRGIVAKPWTMLASACASEAGAGGGDGIGDESGIA